MSSIKKTRNINHNDEKIRRELTDDSLAKTMQGASAMIAATTEFTPPATL